ncbi:uncharacterized protein ACB058_001697 [Synchiropus picturatus]
MSKYLDHVDEVFDSNLLERLRVSDQAETEKRSLGVQTQRLHLEISNKGTITPEPEEEEDEDDEPVRDAADDDHLSYDQYLQLLQELSEKSDVREHNNLLQATLVEFFQDQPEDDSQQDEEVVKWSYEKNLELLAELEEQQAKELEKIKQLSISESSLQKRMDKIKAEGQSKLSSTPKSEQELEEQLNQLCSENIRLQRSIDMLEKNLRGENDCSQELGQKVTKHPETGESSDLDAKINKDLEALTNIQEKLQWAQAEVQTKQSRLSMLDAEVVRKKDLLVQTTQTVHELEEENLSMTRYLQLQRWLQQDHKDTVEDCKRLEEKLESLKRRWIELRGDD